MVMLEQLQDKAHLDRIIKDKRFFILAFYTDISQRSKDALEVLRKLKEENPQIPMYAVNASRVKDIHPLYGIDTVPAVLAIREGRVSKIVYGSQNKEYYQMLLYEEPLGLGKREGREKEGRKFRRVIVYTSSACPWCSKVKSYLRKNRVPFREVDVSRDERVAQELVRRSGQMGVPQTDIDGRIVVGFDKARLDELLGIEGEG